MSKTNAKNTNKKIDLDLIFKLFSNNNSRSYYHIRPKNQLNQIEKLVLENIKKLTDFDFNQVTINCNNQLGKHRHANVGTSYIMLLGDFTGGALCLETGEVFDIKNTWFKFDGRQLHWVEPFKGQRISIVLYRK